MPLLPRRRDPRRRVCRWRCGADRPPPLPACVPEFLRRKVREGDRAFALLPSPRLRRGGVGGGGSIVIDRYLNRGKNAERICQNVLIPETQNAVPLGGEKSCSSIVGGIAGML